MTIHRVTNGRKPPVTTGYAIAATLCDVSEPDLSEPQGRMRWARTRARWKTAESAAAHLGVPSPTYRSYERSVADNGRWPKLARLQRIARAFGVSWLWLQDGIGDPQAAVDETDPGVRRLVEASKVVDISKREDAINAAVSVLRSFERKE